MRDSSFPLSSIMLFLVAGACLLPLAHCGSGAAGPSIILIVVDTLRADHLGCYGYERATSPAVDDLAGEGVLFGNAVTVFPRTLPSVVSILSGLHPVDHHVVENALHVPRRIRLLPEKLAEVGYDTCAVVGNFFLDPRFGIARGFAHYDADFDFRNASEVVWEGGRFLPGYEKRAGYIVDRAIEWLGAERRAPFFLYLHFMDPHAAYDPPEPYRDSFSGGSSLAGASQLGPELPASAISKHSIIDGRTAYSFYIDRYDGEVRYTDDQLARLFAYLRDRGLFDGCLIVLLSDHGEYMGEAQDPVRKVDYFTHGSTLTGAEIGIPLIIKPPGSMSRGRRVDRQVSTLDVLPTILDIAGIAREPVEGSSLLRSLGGGSSSHSPRSILLQARHARYGLLEGRYKLVLDVFAGDGADLSKETVAELGAWELVTRAASGQLRHALRLYDLLEDRWEREDISGRNRPIVGRMLAELAQKVRNLGKGGDEPDEVKDRETLDALRKLGYVQ